LAVQNYAAKLLFIFFSNENNKQKDKFKEHSLTDMHPGNTDLKNRVI